MRFPALCVAIRAEARLCFLKLQEFDHCQSDASNGSMSVLTCRPWEIVPKAPCKQEQMPWQSTMLLRSQYRKCTLHSDFKNAYSTWLNLWGAPLFDKCNPQVHALARKSSWYTFKSGLSTSNLSAMIYWFFAWTGPTCIIMHWSLTSLPSRQPKPIDLASGMRKQSWIGG